MSQTRSESAGELLTLHKDNLNAQSVDLRDPYGMKLVDLEEPLLTINNLPLVSGSLGLFAIHNVIRRNLRACGLNAGSIDDTSLAAFLRYAKYTLIVLKDQLYSCDKIWFPTFAKYDGDFTKQIEAHKPIVAKIAEVVGILASSSSGSLDSFPATEISTAFERISSLIEPLFDEEERLSNQLGRSAPLDEIKEMGKKQEAHRRKMAKEQGQLWSTVYVLRGLSVREREIFPPGIPKLVLGGMLTAGALQYRKYISPTPFSPRIQISLSLC
ncbi:MAG: hypothetical protein M1840_005886 [Geoglossum simile]|nr:MAG: hypothetical protein M1840_005886 [Geoglossum simile]